MDEREAKHTGTGLRALISSRPTRVSETIGAEQESWKPGARVWRTLGKRGAASKAGSVGRAG